MPAPPPAALPVEIEPSPVTGFAAEGDRPVQNPPSETGLPSSELFAHVLEPLASAFEMAPLRFSVLEGAGEPRSGAALLNAWHASYSDFVSLRILREQSSKGFQGYLELFPGDDDRQAIPPKALDLWHNICSLEITASNGTRWRGTGWLAGRRTVITAGHCVFLHGQGGWARKIDVFFTDPTDERSPAAISATEFRCVDGWVKGRDALTDYGAILLPPASSRPTAQVFSCADVPDREFTSQGVAVVGYCLDKPPNTLWIHWRAVREASRRLLRFDRSVFGGLDGSPVLMVLNGKPTVVGIQQDGDFAAATAIRISPEVFRNIQSWVG
jgi:V8-like Glu-specific endopeptidase